MRPTLLARRGINDRCRITRPIDEQFLAGEMRLAHRRRQLLTPINKCLAEPCVAVAVWLLGEMLLPQQCQRHAAPLQLPLDRGPVAGRALICTVLCDREQSPLEFCIVDPIWDRPPDPSRLSPPHILGDLRLASSRRLADLAVAHPERMLQTKHFAYLAHRKSLRRHRWPPFAVQG